MTSLPRRASAPLAGHPVMSLSLGVGIVLSVCAMCTGLGLVAAPWFVCELLGVQLAAAGRDVRPRGRSWVSAATLVLVMLIVAASAGWLAMLGFGPEVATADGVDVPFPWPEALRRVALVVVSCTLAVLFLAPFVHAPLILLDRGGRLGGAMMESATLVRATGLLRHLVIAATALILALTPPVIAGMFVARTWERAATPIGFFAALPLMPISIALGLGLVTATYVETAAALGDARRAQRLEALPAIHRWVMGTLLVAPVLGLLLLGASAFQPAPPVPVPRDPRGGGGDVPGVEVARFGPGDEETIHGTTLHIAVTRDHDVVIANLPEPGDPVPVAWDGPLDLVVVRAVEDDFNVEMISGDRSWLVTVDRAGVRVDDSVRRSLLSHLSGWVLLTFVGSVAVVALFAIRAFAPLGVARARAAREIGTRAVDAAARQESFRVAVALLPFALAALASGALALFRV